MVTELLAWESKALTSMKRGKGSRWNKTEASHKRNLHYTHIPICQSPQYKMQVNKTLASLSPTSYTQVPIGQAEEQSRWPPGGQLVA